MTEMDDYILTEDEQFDVLIIGAGISGLIAAREMRKHEPELKVRLHLSLVFEILIDFIV